MSNAITVRNVSKRYRIGLAEKQHDTIVGQMVDLLKSPFRNLKNLRQLSKFGQEDESVFWALRELEFDVKEGEVLGIIGHNGAGKSTLLKILSRITEPTTGEITIRGRVSSLLEVGTGFHPDLTGRENIYMNGTILGMRKREIDRKLDEIVAFSGVEKYLDTPVKRYSSGMKVRLAFSVAAHLEPEVLIIDEVLAVGDAEFQRKCLGKMNDVAGQGRTILFVSHDMTAVQNLCHNAILLKQGRIQKSGKANEIVDFYYKQSATDVKLEDRQERRGRGLLRFVDYKIINESTGRENIIYSGDTIHFELEYKVKADIIELTAPHFAISVHHIKYGLVTSFSNYYTGTDLSIKNARGKVICALDGLLLLPGEYYATIFCSAGGERQDVIYNAMQFEVLPKDVFGSGKILDLSKHGIFYLNHKWSLLEL